METDFFLYIYKRRVHLFFLFTSIMTRPSSAFNSYNRYLNFTELHKKFSQDLYDKFKSQCPMENHKLAACIVMFVAAVSHYKNPDYVLNIDEFTAEKMRLLRSCFSKTLPEPGTFYGIQMCQMYNMPRQQNNLNVKKPKRHDNAIHCGENAESSTGGSGGGGVIDFYDGEKWLDSVCLDPINRSIYSSESFREHVEKFHSSDKNDLFLSMSQPKVVYTSIMIKTINGLESYKKIVGECLKFSMCLELKKITSDSITFIAYHTNKSFFEKFILTVDNMFGHDSIVIWFTNERTMLTKKFGGDFFVKNYIDYLYCFLTNRYEPDIPKTTNDIVTMMMCRLISGIIRAIGFLSLKSTGLYKAGYTPMSLITTEASLLNIQKMVSADDEAKEYQVYTPSESMFLNYTVTRDESVFVSNFK